MFCTKCGEKLSDGSNFCCKCGEAVEPAEPKDTIVQGEYDPVITEQPPAAESAAQPAASSAANDGILSILGFVFAFTSPLVGLILSLIGWRKPKYRSLGLAGIILSTIILVGILVVVAIGFKNMKDISIPLIILFAAIL